MLLISTGVGGSHRSPPTVLYGEHTAASRQRNLRLGPLSAWQQELTITPSFSFYAPTFFLGMAGFWFVLTHGLNGSSFCSCLLKIAGMPSVNFGEGIRILKRYIMPLCY